mgnify:CR=1 FL=1
MFYINKTLERLSRLFKILINKDYFINHKYQNKNQVTNTNTIFTILRNKITIHKIYLTLDAAMGSGLRK